MNTDLPLAYPNRDTHRPRVTAKKQRGKTTCNRDLYRYTKSPTSSSQASCSGPTPIPQKAVLDALEVRFGVAPESIRKTIESLQDEARLRSLYRTVIQTASLEAFARELEG